MFSFWWYAILQLIHAKDSCYTLHWQVYWTLLETNKLMAKTKQVPKTDPELQSYFKHCLHWCKGQTSQKTSIICILHFYHLLWVIFRLHYHILHILISNFHIIKWQHTKTNQFKMFEGGNSSHRLEWLWKWSASTYTIINLIRKRWKAQMKGAKITLYITV